MKNNLVAALDIGTFAVKMVLAQHKEGGEFEVLGMVQELSRGVRRGAVVNPEEVSRIVEQLKKKLEQMTSQRVDEVLVTLGGSHLFVTTSHGIVAVSRADGSISPEDVERVMVAAQTFSLPSNKEILDVFPQQFAVDGETGIRDVVGMRGVRLEVDVLAICGFSPYVKNVTDAVLGANMGVADIVPISLASLAAVITPQQKELGVAVIDMGAGTTGLTVYEEGDIIHAAVLPVGAENITNDIAIGLKCEPKAAERIKVEFGTCVAPKGKKLESIDSDEGQQLVFSPKFVSHIIEVREKEIFQLVNKELKSIGKQGQLPGGIILVGGGAKLAKVVECAKKELKLAVRLGTPQGITTFDADPSFFAALGLLVRSQDVGETSRGQNSLGSTVKRMFKVFIP